MISAAVVAEVLWKTPVGFQVVKLTFDHPVIASDDAGRTLWQHECGSVERSADRRGLAPRPPWSCGRCGDGVRQDEFWPLMAQCRRA